MPTFNGNTLVSLGGGGQIGITNDNTLPNSGSLTWKSVNTPTDLAGTNGIDCALVHGDFFQLVSSPSGAQLTTITGGNETHKIQQSGSLPGNVTVTIAGDESVTVSGDQHLTVNGEADTKLGSRTLHIYGDDKIIEDGNRDLTVSGKDSETFASPREVEEPAHWESNDTDMGWKTFIAEVCLLKLEACLTLHLELKTLHVAAEILEGTGKLLSNKLKALEMKIIPLGAKIGALDAKMDAEANGAPTVSTSAPFGA